MDTPDETRNFRVFQQPVRKVAGTLRSWGWLRLRFRFRSWRWFRDGGSDCDAASQHSRLLKWCLSVVDDMSIIDPAYLQPAPG